MQKFKFQVGQFRVSIVGDGHKWRMSLYRGKTYLIHKETDTSGEAFRQALAWLELEGKTYKIDQGGTK